MTDQLRLFLLALRHYTRLPVSGRLAEWVGPDTQRDAHRTRYFPLVGVMVGMLQALVFMLASVVLPHTVAVVLAIIIGLMLTGALHEAGWARFCESLGRNAEQTVAPADGSDSRHVAYGAVGVAMLLLLRYETLAHIDVDWIAAALICAAAFSRGCAVLVTTSLPHADAVDRQAPNPPAFAPDASASDAIVALAVGLLPLLLLTVWIGDAGPAALTIALTLLAAAVVRRLMRRRPLHEHPGDRLGAVQQVAEAVFLLGLLVSLGVPIEEELPEPLS